MLSLNMGLWESEVMRKPKSDYQKAKDRWTTRKRDRLKSPLYPDGVEGGHKQW